MLEISAQTSAACPEPSIFAEVRCPSPSICLDVGLVNNMPDAALKGTEGQFSSLLDAAAGDNLRIRVHYFSMREVPRGEEAQLYMRGQYRDAVPSAYAKMDALIVTGNEPRAASLKEERHWNSLTALADFAVGHAIPTIWSCLAAHAAVLHLDQIKRQPVGRKRFGLFDCETASQHPLVDNLPPKRLMPHSRHNEILEEDLRRAGYQTLSRSAEAGVDIFVKTFGGCDFVFFQGHPEYACDTLLREYRRDISRYLSGEQDDCPAIPNGYLDRPSEEQLYRIVQRAKTDRAETLAAEFLEATQAAVANSWRDNAVTIYRNWLAHIVDVKQSRSHAGLSLAG